LVRCDLWALRSDDRRTAPILKRIVTMRVVHYVGFSDDRYWNAFRVFGGPRVFHRWWDRRAVREIAPGDVVIFADGDWQQQPRPFNAPDIDEPEPDARGQ
jgi:hypothetical protein